MLCVDVGVQDTSYTHTIFVDSEYLLWASCEEDPITYIGDALGPQSHNVLLPCSMLSFPPRNSRWSPFRFIE